MHRILPVAMLLACGSRVPVEVLERPPEDPIIPPDPVVLVSEDAGTSPTAPCASVTPEATLSRSAIDIVLLVDNSDSMAAEAEAIEQHINQELAARLSEAEVDYRVILISEHRAYPREGRSGALCIEQPLSGLSNCNFADRPVLSSRFFQYSARVGSQNSLSLFVDTLEAPFASATYEDTYANAPQGWSQWLRSGAPKVVVAFSDDDALLTAQDFMAQLFEAAPGHFGSADLPNFVFHSVTGLQTNQDGSPYSPQTPIVSDLCGDPSTQIASAGENLQEASRRTGGLRFSLCDTSAYDTLFRTVAQNVVVTSNLPCSFDIPSSQTGQGLDLDRVQVSLLDETGEQLSVLGQVSSGTLCGSDAFFVDSQTGKIQLCEQACTQARQALAKSLELTVACESTILR